MDTIYYPIMPMNFPFGTYVRDTGLIKHKQRKEI